MAHATVDDDRLAQFAANLRGEVLTPADGATYDHARAVWNGMIDRRPAVIARCTGVADVQAAVRFGRETGLPVTVRGGGHNVSGSAVCDDGLVIDCSEMTAVRVDPVERTAWVQGGAMWADVDRETQAFGLATPGGVVSDTGVAGLTLGGGIGHLRCRYGLSCDNLRAVELVTADGEFVRASPTDRPALFWGLRGGGGPFGVVTGFEFELHPVGPEIATLLVFYPATELRSVLREYREFVAAGHDAISTLVFAGELPDEELFDGAAVHQQKFAIMGAYAGDPAAGVEALAPLRGLADPLADYSGTMPYAEFQAVLDEDYPDGMRYYWKSLYLDDLSDSAIDRIAYWAENAPSPLSTVDVWELGGAIADVDHEASAFAGRHAPFLLGVEANWEDPANDATNVDWVRDCLDDMRQYSDGAVYLNFPGFYEDADDVLATTFGDAYDRLTELAARYDPDGLFRQNQDVASVAPSSTEDAGSVDDAGSAEDAGSVDDADSTG